MSTISKERLEEKRAAALLLTEYKHEDVRLAAQENVQVIDELLALRKEREAAVPVAIIDQANLDYLKSGADADVWPPERAVVGDMPLYAAPPAQPVAVPECFLNAVSALESLYRNGQKQCWHERYTTDMAYASGVLNACRAAMLATPGKEG